MAFRIEVLEEQSLLLGFAWETVTLGDLKKAAADLRRQPGYRPGLDRIQLVDRSADLSCLEAADLAELKKMVAALETPPGAHGPPPLPTFRGALVCADGMKAMLLNLYSALWGVEENPGVEFRVFSDPEEALAWFGRPDLRLPDAFFRGRAGGRH